MRFRIITSALLALGLTLATSLPALRLMRCVPGDGAWRVGETGCVTTEEAYDRFEPVCCEYAQLSRLTEPSTVEGGFRLEVPVAPLWIADAALAAPMVFAVVRARDVPGPDPHGAELVLPLLC